MTQDTEDVVADGLDVQQVFALEAADELEQLGKRAQGMLSAIPAIVAEERIEQHNLVYECEAKRWFRLAKGVRACAEAIAERQSLSDRIDVQVEAAYREGWHEGYATGDAGGSYTAVELDWLGSDARAALHQEGIAPK